MANLPGINYQEDTGNPTTGAPGGGDISLTQPGTGSTGAPNAAGTAQAVPQDLVPVAGTHTSDGTPVHHTLPENVFGVVDQSSLSHGGVEAAQAGRLAMGVGSNPTSTGAGSTDVDHNHYSQGSN